MRCLFSTLLAGAAGVLLATAPSLAQGDKKELRYASSAPPKTVWAMQTERFEKLADEESKGTLKINSFINSQLGSEQDTIQQVARGRIDMGGYSITAASLLVPELSLLNIPFLFKSAAEQDCVLDNHVSKLTGEMLAKRGVHFIGWAEVGVASIIGKKPYLHPDELKGVKARSQPSKVAQFMWQQFGAHPNPLPVTEWNSAFQTGLIEVADSSPTYYFFSGLAKLAPVVTLTQHQDQAAVVIINKAIYDGLSAQQKKGIDGIIGKVPATQLRKEIREHEAKIYEMHKQQGGTIVTITAEQRAAWQKGIEAAHPKMIESVGGESGAYWKAIQDGIKACARKA